MTKPRACEALLCLLWLSTVLLWLWGKRIVPLLQARRTLLGFALLQSDRLGLWSNSLSHFGVWRSHQFILKRKCFWKGSRTALRHCP